MERIHLTPEYCSLVGTGERGALLYSQDETYPTFLHLNFLRTYKLKLKHSHSSSREKKTTAGDSVTTESLL